MKKLLLLLLAVSPLFSIAQERGNAEETKSREERAKEMQERQEAARKSQQGTRPGAVIGPNASAMMLYSEIVMTVRSGGKQSVAFTMDASVKEGASERDAQALSKLSSNSYDNLVAALNAAAKFDWQIVTSYEVEFKDYREIHFVMSKEVPLSPEEIRGRNQETRNVSGRSGSGREGSGNRARTREGR